MAVHGFVDALNAHTAGRETVDSTSNGCATSSAHGSEYCMANRLGGIG